MSTSVAALRALIQQRFPDATPLTGGAQTTEHVATGMAELDKVLPNGGLPRGRLSVWAPQGGATAILRASCHSVVAKGERSAWIDGDNTVAGAFWGDGPYLVRPKSRLHALRAGEELLRSGGFSLLVIAGAEPQGTEMVRLTRAAREGGTALVALGTSASMASLRLTSRLLRYRWRRTPFGDPAEAQDATVRVSARAVGWSAHTDFPIPVMHHELRLSLESELADRRGLPR
ncbi:MAG: RecA domain protein [Gemmatimonadetes bacterium]|nr:RecA domain protein [Gemmatimonadota bacterium]